MSARRWSTAAAIVSIAAVAYVLSPDSRPNLVWITVDGLRPDRLTAFGAASGPPTASIDYLARNGVVFEQAVSDAPWSGAALASAMTARFAAAHGLRTSTSRLSKDPATIAEILDREGYRTAAVVGSFDADRVFGFDRGFDLFDDRYDTPSQVGPDRPHVPRAFFEQIDAERTYRVRKLQADSARSDAAIADAAVAWIRRAGSLRPYFLWVHFFGPQRRKPRGLDLVDTSVANREYGEAVTSVDEAIGRVLAELDDAGVLDRTVIVFQGSHGESLNEHGELGHGTNLYDPVLRVPLIIAWPGRLSPARVAAMVRSIDVGPTAFDLLGVRPPADLDGRSLRPLLRNEPIEEQPLLAETWIPAEASLAFFNSDGTARLPGIWRRGVRTSEWKYIRSDPARFVNYSEPPELPADADRYRGEELYDLRRDPAERVNVAAAHPDIVARFRQLIEPIPPVAAPPARRAS